jgi:hypothetical protein
LRLALPYIFELQVNLKDPPNKLSSVQFSTALCLAEWAVGKTQLRLTTTVGALPTQYTGPTAKCGCPVGESASSASATKTKVISLTFVLPPWGDNWSERSACAACAALQTGCAANMMAAVGPSEVRALPLRHVHLECKQGNMIADIVTAQLQPNTKLV